MKKLLLFLSLTILSIASPLIDGEYVATGYSAPGQSKYAATIAAKADAQRQLLEQIYATKLNSKTTLKNKKQVKSAISGVLRGAKIISKKYDKSTKTAEVKMKVSSYKIIKTLKKKKILEGSFYDELKEKNTPKITKIKEIIYDGLIVDARDLKDIEPAIYNNIYSDGKLLFDAIELESKSDLSEGTTMITSTKKSAISFLSSFGVQKPMFVKAINTMELKSDIEIALNDANKIIKDNNINSYLNKCRVVFLVKKSK